MYHPKLLLVIIMGNDIIKSKRAEEALRDANQFNIEIVSQAGEGIVVYDRNLRYVVWNQFMERLTGALAEYVIGRKALDLFPHLIEQGVDLLLKRALNGETVTSSDTPFDSPFTNQTGWMVGTYAPHRNALGEIIGVIATVRDITERKRTEEALRESEERYRTVVSSASDGIILQESTGKILTWNMTVEKVFGVKAAEALDHTSNLRNWRTIREDGSEFSGDDHPSVHTLMTGEPCKNVVMGVRNATTDQLSWISISTSPLFRGGEPKPYAVVISFSDITKRKLAEEELRKTRNYLENLIDYANAPIIVWDPYFSITRFNHAFELLTGLKANEVLDEPLAILFPENSREESMVYIRRTLLGEHWDVVEIPILNMDGSVRIVLWNSASIYDESGKIIATIAQGTDITERKRTEEALKESEERYRNLVERANDGITIIQGGTIQYANPALVKLWDESVEASVENIIGRPFTDFIDPDEIPKIVERYKRRMAKDSVTPMMYETILRRNDGSKVFVELNAGLVTFHGTPIDLVIIRDITERKRMEVAMRDSENKLAAIIEFLPDATFVIDMDGKVIAWNRAIEEMTGVSKSDMIGQGDHAYTVPFYGERREQLLDLLDKDDEEIASKYQYVQRNGDILYAETFASALYGGKGAYVWATVGPIFDVQGNRIGAIESIRDITERKRAEDELKRVQSSMRIAMDLVKLVRWEYDVEKDMFAFDDQFYALYGTTAEREGGPLMSSQDYARKFIPPEEASIVAEETRKALETTDPNFTSQVEHRIIRADGTEGVIAVRFGIVKDSKGRTIRTYGANQDITERKRAEDALRGSRDYLDKIINSIGDPIFVKDRQHRFILVNNALCALANRTCDEFIGKTDYDFFPREQVDVFLKKDEVVFETGKENVNEETIMDSQGVSRTIVTKKTLYTDASGEKSIVGIIRDITERKRSEEALRKAHDELELRVKERTEELSKKNAEMEQFIYTVSHDLRTPLISVSGFLGFIEQDAQKGDLDRLKNDLRITNEAVTKMDRLLMETLELSRIGRVVNPPEGVPFGEIVEDALRQTNEIIKSKGCKVTVAQNLPVVHVDRMRIAEVLVNLIENSMKYMGSQAYLEIEIGQRIDGKDRIFFVRDNGIGIDPNQHDKVFELFYKVDKKSEGSGAGLAIVKRILEVHGGRIWIESDPGKGCTVCFTLPLANVR